MDFHCAAALKASADYESADTHFDSVVSGVQSSGKAKREAAAGIGNKAAFGPGIRQLLVAVQHPDGIISIIGLNLTKAQILALARTAAAP